MLKIFKVRDRSMEPYLNSGDYVLATRLYAKLKEGDTVVLKHPAKPMTIIKRVKKIVPGSLYVAGDNQQLSEDSRSFGLVRMQNVLGKVIARF